MNETPVAPGVVLLMGGSFDPVHAAHVAVAGYFVKLMHPDVLRLLPAGDPWQKPPLHAAAADRVKMLELAFAKQPVPVVIDTQEITRGGGSYTIDTLRALRAELGERASLSWIMGADQLMNFHRWHEWRALFGLTNFLVASRPGYLLDEAGLDPEVAKEFKRRQASAAQLRACPHGLTLLAPGLAHDLSATAIRAQLARGERAQQALPDAVLDYVEQHQLYRS